MAPPDARDLVEQPVEDRLRALAEGLWQRVCETRARLHDDIRDAEDRAAYHAERRDEKLETTLLDLLTSIEQRVAALEKCVGIERRLAALEQRATLQLPPARPRLITGRGGDDTAA